ncbi:uncharacterized protein AMSG_00408 [Thecamonas trahens ATCC 50062]|uniref:Legume lectin domain-containing protein n=1 Tax=Thecamonas trahens ATCC 50062 TaxID=461836 RepID=A0A0L0D9A7_THETB|nr:hypothetical protein AMSG_00408 [Thecamonas trahens ATCC 50062]KNC48631.1 hypothetical protein AMSG_00408 [Thecamonas trahens ATCC 50062]|eukprot:XP_013762687.1 hypothetical protein AMSG_00408 [Thecamonas trahens ATCC 50062]
MYRSSPVTAFTAAVLANNMTLTRSEGAAGDRLRMTPDTPRWSSSARWSAPMLVRGFETSLTFEMSNVAAGGGRDGLALVILNSPQTTGTYGGGIGYGDLDPTGLGGLPNSFAIEMDTFSNPELGDPSSDHISVHSAGTAPNSADEASSARLCPIITGIVPMANPSPSPYTVTVRYEPPYGWDASPDATATLTVWAEGIQPPVGICHLPRNHTLNELLDLGAGGTASLMITGATDDTADVQDVLAWSYAFLGAANANTSRASGTGLAGGSVGANLPVAVQLHDQYGYPYHRDAAALECQLTLLELGVSFPCTPGADGSYSGSYSATVAGSHNLDVTLDGVAVVGAPFAVQLAPGAVDATASTVADVAATVTAGDASSFSVTIHDQYGNVVDSDSVVITAHILPVQDPTPSFTFIYTGDGVYTCTMILRVTGSSTLSLSIGGVGVQGGAVFDVAVTPGPVDPARTKFAGAAQFNAVAGVASAFSLQLYDAFGNTVAASGTTTPVTASFTAGPAPVTAAVSPAVKGNVTVSYTATITGTYALDVTVGDGTDAASFPSSVLVVTDNVPDPSKCVAAGAGINAAHVAGAHAVFTVTPRDAYGNLVSQAKTALAVTISSGGGGATVDASSTYNSQTGSFDVAYDATVAGDYTIAVTVNSAPILHSPFDMTVVPARADPTASHVRATSSSALSSTVTGRTESFLVLVEDAFGNVLASLGNNSIAAHITGPRSYAVSCAEVHDPSIGAAVSCSYSIDKTGTYELWIMVDNEPALGSPFRISVSWAHTLELIIGLIAGVGVLAMCITGFFVVRSRSRRTGFVRL